MKKLPESMEFTSLAFGDEQLSEEFDWLKYWSIKDACFPHP